MPIALRMDDVNASSKYYNQYSKKWRRFPIGNIGFLKKTNFFKAWAPYEELSPNTWERIYKIIENYNSRLTIAITATWVTKNKELIPVYENIPEQVKIINEGVKKGLFEIANHGLTHCVLINNKYLPKYFSGNRKYHREFWEWIPEEIHLYNIKHSQNILEKTFNIRPKIFVPPGNVFTNKTLKYAKDNGLTMMNCNFSNKTNFEITSLNNENVFDFHDREIAIYGTKWLEDNIKKIIEKDEICLVSELFDY